MVVTIYLKSNKKHLLITTVSTARASTVRGGTWNTMKGLLNTANSLWEIHFLIVIFLTIGPFVLYKYITGQKINERDQAIFGSSSVGQISPSASLCLCVSAFLCSLDISTSNVLDSISKSGFLNLS